MAQFIFLGNLMLIIAPGSVKGQQFCKHSVMVNILPTNEVSLCRAAPSPSNAYTMKNEGCTMRLYWRFDKIPKKVVVSGNRPDRYVQMNIRATSSSCDFHDRAPDIQENDQNLIAFLSHPEGECAFSATTSSAESSDALTWTILDM